MKKQLLTITLAFLGAITFASAQKTSITFDATNLSTQQTFNFGKQSTDDLDIDIVTAVSGVGANAADNNSWIGVLAGANTSDAAATFKFTIASDGATVSTNLVIGTTKRQGNIAEYTISAPGHAPATATFPSAGTGTTVDNNTITYSNVEIPSTGLEITITLNSLDHGTVENLANRPVFRFSTIKIQALAALSIDSDIETTEETSLFPNPVTDTFQLSSNEGIETVQVYSISGSLVKTFNASNSYDISDLASGVYFVNTGSKTVKIVKN